MGLKVLAAGSRWRSLALGDKPPLPRGFARGGQDKPLDGDASLKAQSRSLVAEGALSG